MIIVPWRHRIEALAGWGIVFALAFFGADFASLQLRRAWDLPGSLPFTAHPGHPPVRSAQPAQAVERLLRTSRESVRPTAASPAKDSYPKPLYRLDTEFSLMGTLCDGTGAGLAFFQNSAGAVCLNPGEKFPASDLRLVSVSPNSASLASPLTRMTVEVGGTLKATRSDPDNEDYSQAVSESQEIVPLTSLTELRGLLDQPAKILTPGFRVKPHLTEGELRGIEVTLPASSHPLARLGLQTGDIVLSVNGTKVEAEGGVSKLLPVLRNSSILRIELIRDGIPQKLRVELD